nr:basic salivary proline-rich protein 2-like [Aegilops tauschii subsp. strangulata]
MTGWKTPGLCICIWETPGLKRDYDAKSPSSLDPKEIQGFPWSCPRCQGPDKGRIPADLPSCRRDASATVPTSDQRSRPTLGHRSGRDPIRSRRRRPWRPRRTRSRGLLPRGSEVAEAPPPPAVASGPPPRSGPGAPAGASPTRARGPESPPPSATTRLRLAAPLGDGEGGGGGVGEGRPTGSGALPAAHAGGDSGGGGDATALHAYITDYRVARS